MQFEDRSRAIVKRYLVDFIFDNKWRDVGTSLDGFTIADAADGIKIEKNHLRGVIYLEGWTKKYQFRLIFS